MKRSLLLIATAMLLFSCNNGSSDKQSADKISYGASVISGTTYYVSTSGNDAGNGSATAPWKTLYKATQTVTKAGDGIHVNSGTYTEANRIVLAKGVSIEGDGAGSTIFKAASGSGGEFISLQSTQGTDGSQSVSGITIDGQYASESNKGAGYGIWVTGRSNVSIYDCKILNFYYSGVIFDGTDGKDFLQDPGVYATGNKFYRNDVLNCSTVDPSHGNGCLMIGGQTGMVIDSNNIGTTTRPNFKNGWAIKYWDNGWLKGCKITNNKLTKPPYQATYWGQNGDWDFVIELFNISGLEIGYNTLQGAVDLNYNYKGNYPYSVWIHNNTSNHAVPNYTHPESAYIFEFKTESMMFENNTVNNAFVGISYNLRYPNNHGGYGYNCGTGGCSAVIDNIIRNNLFTNLYSAYGASGGIITQMENGTEDPYITGMQIYNNTFIAKATQAAPVGIDFTSQSKGTVSGITIKDNIFQGFPAGSVTGNKAPTQSNISITNNDAWQTALPSWTGAVLTANFSSNPNFNANYVSPLGIGYGGSGAPPSNQAPTADAGPDLIVTLPTNSVDFLGNGTDPDGQVVGYLWSIVSGSGTLSNPSAQGVTLSGLTQGVTVIALRVVDDKGAFGYDTMRVTTNGSVQVNLPPTADAGVDQVISLSLRGKGADPENGPLTFKWVKTSGPSCTIVSPNSEVTQITGIKKGIFVFTFSVTDDKGQTKTDTVSITVN